MAAKPDPLPPAQAEPGAEDITLSDEEWPVAEQYRVEPQPAPTAGELEILRRDERGAVVFDGARTRRFPPRLSLRSVLLLALLFLLLLIPAAAWLLSAGESPGTARVTTPTTPTPTGEEPAAPAPTTAKAVPDVTGLTLAEARSLLEKAGFRAQVRGVTSNRPDGQILRQAPAAGSEASPSSLVALTVSREAEGVSVPDLVGLTASDASRVLRDAGLRPAIRFAQSSEPAGTVTAQAPSSGTEVDENSVVWLTVAKAAPAAVEVPSLVGTSASDARSRLREIGLRWRQSEVASSQPAGTVVGQSPGAGAELRKGGQVTLKVSSGPAQTTVPDVTGLDEQSARQQLEAAGFEVQVVDQPTTVPNEDGLVLDQNPTGGARRAPGAVVTLTVARLG